MSDINKTNWNKISTRKLGHVGTIPILPMLPVGMQVRPSLYGAAVHYKMDDMGHYINGGLPYVPPSKIKAVIAAVKEQPKEDSYSDSGSQYYRMTVCADPDHADRFLVKAGDLVIGYGIIDPMVEIMSSDEPMSEQVDGETDPEADGE